MGKLDPAIFDSAPAAMTPDIFGDKQKTTGVIRVLHVEERMGFARNNELVRVPLFFHKGECADPNGLKITPAGGGAPMPYQADDIRRDADGQVARMHVYFVVSLAPWERRAYEVSPGQNPGAALPALPIVQAGDVVTLGGNDLKLAFFSKGDRAGAIAGLDSSLGKLHLADGYMGPSINLIRQGKDLKVLRENLLTYADPTKLDIKELTWGSGPLFAKLRVKLAPKGLTDIAEYTYLVPKFGTEFVQMERLYPQEKDSPETVGATANALLAARVDLGDAAGDRIVSVPAGLRPSLTGVFKYSNDALVNDAEKLSLFMVPYVQQGARGITKDAAGQLNFNGSLDFQTRAGSNSGTLRVFWDQARFVLSRNTEVANLEQLSNKSFQNLTAVVDEPWATPQDLDKFARQLNESFWQIKYWGRSLEANLVMNYLSGKEDAVTKMLDKNPDRGLDLRPLIPSQEEIDAAFKKGQGAGQLDPYGFTYSKSALALISAYLFPNDRLDKQIAVMAQASRLVNGRVTSGGWPHVRSFANAANMHQGTYMMAIYGGNKTGDHDLAQWARDASQSQNLLATYGHGQRPYSINTGSGDQSDQLYISITDFWLRASELLNNEDFSIHPSVFGRYSEDVDVNADIYQRKITPEGSEPAWYRATMFRGQSHDHRWGGFGADPFLRVLDNAPDGGTVGITEACYYMQRNVGKPVSWNILMTDVFFPDIMANKGLAGYKPPVRPGLPTQLQVKFGTGGNVLSWTAPGGADAVAGYRIYRADNAGGPWIWLNSPYKDWPAFKAPSAADFTAAKDAAIADDTAKATAQNVDLKKLKDKTAVWSKMPEVQVAPLPDTLVKATIYTDPAGKVDSVYFVTAQDKAGRESRWFPNEPVPAPGK